ncbi:MAG TPA: hypothetical protein PK257_02510, partial [Candidatus Woesebacteria bacterium]|nr:hypothetical protein [Candidatus Woesebacteria bacterium]
RLTAAGQVAVPAQITYTASTGVTLVGNDFRLNLAYTPVWTGLHTFTNGIGVSGTTNLTNALNVGGTATFNSYVGIGTATPIAKLQVGNGVGNSIPTTWNQVNSGRLGIVNGNKSFYLTLESGIAEFSTWDYANSSPINMEFNANGGNSIFGTWSITPLSKLAVYGNQSIGTNYSAFTAPTNGLLVEGNVGIGTTAPTKKLDVIGDSSFSTNLSVGGTVSLTGTNVGTGTTALFIASNGTVTKRALNDIAFNGTLNLQAGTSMVITGTGVGSTISHADTSSQASSNNSNGVVIQDITLDGLGHLTSLGTVDLDTRFIQNQFASAQSTSNFWISGTGLVAKFGIGATSSSILNVVGDGNITTNLTVGNTLNANSINVGGTNVITSTKLFMAANGTVSLPSYSFITDTDTGLWRPTTNNLSLSVGATEALRILASGNIGLGTTNPSEKLDVIGNIKATGNIIGLKFLDIGNTLYGLSPSNVGPTNSSLALSVSGSIRFNYNEIGGVHILTGAASRIQNLGSGLLIAASGTSNAGAAVTGWDNQLFLKVGGYVGIGTTNPTAKLEIAGASSSISNTSGDITINSASNNVSFSGDNLINIGNISVGGTLDAATIFQNGSPISAGSSSQWTTSGTNIYFTGVGATGYVGIGTTNPSMPLQLNGNALFGATPTSSYYTVAPLNIANNAANTFKTQLNLINAGGGGGAGSAIDFYTYTDQSTSSGPGARFGAIDDNSFSGSLVFSTKNPGNPANTINERMRIESGGNVGIGTTNPDYKLDVFVGSDDVQINGTSSIGNGLILTNTDSTAKSWYLASLGNSPGEYGPAKGFSIYDETSNAVRFAISANGNIGIGITSPTAKLHVYDTTTLSSLALFRNNTDGVAIEIKSIGTDRALIKSGAGDSLNFGVANSDVPSLTILSSGYVGIGTTAPSRLFTVYGNGTTNGVAYFESTDAGKTRPVVVVKSAGTGSTGVFIQFLNSSNSIIGRIRSGSSTSTVYGTSGTNDLAEYVLGDEPTEGTDLIAFHGDKFGKARPGEKIAGTYSNYGTFVGNESLASQENSILLALRGIVDVKVSSDHGPISAGDNLAISNIPGVAAKATQSGYIVGQALESYSNPNTSTVGLVKVMINPGYYEADLSLTSTGQININYNVSPEVLSSLGYDGSKNEIESATYSLTDSLNNTVDRISQFAEIASAKIKTGFLSATNIITKNIVAEKVISPKANIEELTSTKVEVTDTLTTQNLIAKEATISTLYADNIISKEGSFGDLMAQKVSSLRDEIKKLISTNTATSSAITGSSIMSQSSDWSMDIASDSAKINGDLALTNNLIVGAKLMVQGDTELGNAFVTGTFTTGEIAIKDNLIETTNSALYIQPSSTGSVHIMGDTLVIAENGEVEITGNLKVSGSLIANLITADEIQTNKLTSKQLISDEIKISTDSAQTIVAESGFGAIATSSSKLTSNATAGSAVLPAGKTEIIINNNKINNESMIYLTPVGSTNNQVPYIKSKFITPTPTPTEATASAEIEHSNFIIAIDQALATDVTINWWIIN